MKLPPRLLALGAFFVAAIALAACGGSSIPGNSVAKVDGTSITKDDFNHWLKIAAISSQGQTDPDVASGKKAAEIPDAPDFTKCVAEKQKTAPTPAKGQPKPTTAQFKQQCQTEYNGLRDQVLQFLISAQWIVGEAKDQGIKVTDSEVNTQFETTKKQSFPKEADFQKFLKSSGMGLDDLKFRVRVQALSDKLRTKVTKGKDTVTPAQITDYYNKNKSRFAQPERRDLRIVLTKTKAKADQALAALKSGQSFKSVAKKYSIDQASKNQGGKLLAVAKGQQEKALDDAERAARELGRHDDRRVSRPDEVAQAVGQLDELTRRLRTECPWDREQDERSIVPHTVEESYELADAAQRGDDAKLLDELGDVLFQVHFLALLLEERGAGSLADVAEHARQKLIRRHPHVFGSVEVEHAGEVLRNWDQIKLGEEGREPGIFGEVPENLPGPLYARKVQRRAATSGFDFDGVPYEAISAELSELEAAHTREERFHEAGDVLFAAVNVARKLKVDPELALRAAADRFRGRVEAAEDLASRAGASWNDLSPEQQLGFYAQARLNEDT